MIDATLDLLEGNVDLLEGNVADGDELAIDELLVEEVSIDGMCGVY